MFKTKLKTTNYSKYTEIYFPSIFLVVVVIYKFISAHFVLYVLNIIAVHLLMYISVVRKFRSVSYCDLTNEHVSFEYYKYLLLKIYNQ